jgi:hypothetical protein
MQMGTMAHQVLFILRTRKTRMTCETSLLLNMEWIVTRMKYADQPAEALPQTHERHTRPRKNEDKQANNKSRPPTAVEWIHDTSAGYISWDCSLVSMIMYHICQECKSWETCSVFIQRYAKPCWVHSTHEYFLLIDISGAEITRYSD